MDTHIGILLDRSGSMAERADDHEGGLRSFVREQRAQAGHARLTFARFDSMEPFEIVIDAEPIQSVNEERLRLIPRGNTPLVQAMTQFLAHLDQRAASDDQVIAMVITDGYENASGAEYTRAALKARTEELQKRGWLILYLGANVDEFSEAAGLGIAANASLGYAASRRGVANTYGLVGQTVNSVRSAYLATGQATNAVVFDAKDRLDARAEDDEKAFITQFGHDAPPTTTNTTATEGA